MTGVITEVSEFALAFAIPNPTVVIVGLTFAGLGQGNIVPGLFDAAGGLLGYPFRRRCRDGSDKGYGAVVGEPFAICTVHRHHFTAYGYG